jgi:hypothetical protein
MENITYETKCRRCNEIIISEANKPFNETYFLSLMHILRREPPLLPCPKCGIFTVQDIVSYSIVGMTQQDFELTQQQTDLIEKIQNGK